MPALNQTNFICIDCEATGLDRKKDRIIEIAYGIFNLEHDKDTFESLVDPRMIIPQESIEIHHITQDMVRGKPLIEEVLPQVLKAAGNHIIVGHGILFDIEMIDNEAKRVRIPSNITKNPYIDTLRLARLYGDSPTNSLEVLRRHFNISEEGAHRALNDVIVNMEVFRRLVQKFKTTEELFKVLSKPIRLKAMPLGKYKGRLFKEIPLPYLRWAANMDFDQDLLFSIRSEIKRRSKDVNFSSSSNPFHSL
jgi:DNA polymerase-3 subunit epsilon